jgi:hypothetical protein
VIHEIVVGSDQRSCEIEQIQVREAECDRGRMGKYFQGLSSFNRRERDMGVCTDLYIGGVRRPDAAQVDIAQRTLQSEQRRRRLKAHLCDVNDVSEGL